MQLRLEIEYKSSVTVKQNLFWEDYLMCEQVLFVYVLTAVPPQLSDSCNFTTVLLVTREPEQTTLFSFEARRLA